MAKKTTNLLDFGTALADVLGDYSESVDTAIKNGVDEAANCFIKNAQELSPKDTGEYKNSWAVKDSKPKYRRYVGNTKQVKGKKGMIPLINILEYSTTRGRPHVRKAAQASKAGILQIFEKHLKEA